MKKTLLFLTLSLVFSHFSTAQDFTSSLYDTYDRYKEPTLDKRRIKHSQIIPLVNKLRANPKFEVNKIGESIEGRDLHLISFGKGGTDIFLWSQMHGDESTATMALLDLFNFFNSNDDQFNELRKMILDKLELHFIPMLNPDGAERFTRRKSKFYW